MNIVGPAPRGRAIAGALHAAVTCRLRAVGSAGPDPQTGVVFGPTLAATLTPSRLPRR